MERHRSKAGLRCGCPTLCRFELISRSVLGRPEHTPGGSDGGSKNGSANMIGPIVGGKASCLVLSGFSLKS